jgi:hypothetical protein
MEKVQVMAIDLYGDYIFDATYYAKKLIALGTDKPYYKLKLLPDYIDNRFAVRIYDSENLIPVCEKKGYYVIYKRNLFLGSEQSIYAGYTNDSIYKRIWRFGIELCNMQDLIKTSGTHPGGRKYRLMGGTRDDLCVKFVLHNEIPFDIPEEHVETLDENLAYLLGTLCNTKRKT